MKNKSKGHYSHNYDPDRLRQLIQENKTAKEIMQELQISRFSLYEQLFMLQEEDQVLYDVPELIESAAQGGQKTQK